jgi:threonine synthase
MADQVPANSNLAVERETFVTHLECSLTGERYEADRLHGLSPAGRPLLVRYDLAAAGSALSRDALEARPTDLWRWRELLPVRRAASIVSLGEIETPLVPVPASAGPNVLVKDEGRLPTGSFKARGLVMAVAMARELGVTRIAMPTNGNAGAALAAYASRAGIETIVLCPEDTPEINVREIAAQGARVWRVNGLIDDCGAIVGKGAAEGRWFDFSTLKAGTGRAAWLAAAQGDLLSDRRRHRAYRDVEGVRRTRAARLDRVGTPQNVRGPGERLRADRQGLRGRGRARRTLGKR